MLKKILKLIFPTPFLKAGFRVYNKIKISTIDKVLFPELQIARKKFFLYAERFPFVENKIDISDISDPEVSAYMNQWNKWTQEEFILIWKETCWIEPVYGWAIVPPSKLIYFSLGISRSWTQRKPPLTGFLLKKDTVVLKRAISLRDSGEQNYFHFYNDVLTKIFLLHENKIEVQHVPIIVSRKLWEAPYFQYYLCHSSFFAALQWTIQDAQFIKCEEVVFCKPLTHRWDLLQRAIAPIIMTGNGMRRIFLTRSKDRMRFIENSDEIESICRSLGFEVINTDSLQVHEQIECFSNASWVVAIHGAALTNLLFRAKPCQVFEIFPPPELGYLPFHYIMLAKMSGFRYNAMIGEKSRERYSGGFYVTPEILSTRLKDFFISERK